MQIFLGKISFKLHNNKALRAFLKKLPPALAGGVEGIQEKRL